MKDLSVLQVAKILNCTPRHVLNLIYRGSLQNAYKLDPNSKSVYRIAQSDVDEFIAQQRANKKPPAVL